ncbi:SMC family ATPase [Nonomuraea sp. NPDC050310]|uniref:SMC family ATPase n=1 Tax=Nonomuraea sp. NPDC050310 TaxID=3154935 RepID=UPI0033CA65C6
MRPLQLTFSGLRSYPGQTPTLDFSGKALIAILGDTGAGKTSILEAITLALYGASSWSNRVRELLADGASAMTVDLTFTHHEHTWRVCRVYYANNRPSTHLLQNLDTGEEVDDSRAVNRRVEHLLKLKRDEFQAAVLLPQGRFDRLLTATDAERAELLKGIFGTRFLETARTHAERRRDSLKELLHLAQLARRDFFDQPRICAEQASGAAQAAERLTNRLSTAYATMRKLQTSCSRHARRRDYLDVALDHLSQPAARPDTTVLDSVAQAAHDLGKAQRQLIERRGLARTRHLHAQTWLEQAANQGITTKTIAGAQAVLTDLPARQEALLGAQAQLSTDEHALGKEEAELQRMATDLEQLRSEADTLATRAATLREQAERAAAEVAALDNATRAALAAAITAGHAAAAVTAANATHLAAQGELPTLHAAHEQARTAAATAMRHHEAARREEAAHAAGHGLRPGDSCSVCTRDLPTGFQPPAPVDPAHLQRLERERARADGDLARRSEALTRARGHAETAEQALATLTEQHATASSRAANRLAAALAAAGSTAIVAGEAVTTADHDGETFAQRLDQTAAPLLLGQTEAETADDQTDDDARAVQLTASLCAPAHHLARSLAETADSARQQAQTAAADARSVGALLSTRGQEHAARAVAHVQARRQHRAAIDAVRESLRRLPSAVGEPLHATPSTITHEDITTAIATCARLSKELTQTQTELAQATADLAEIETQQARLEHQRDTEITVQLTTLHTAAIAYLGTLHRAHQMLDTNTDTAPRVVLPSPPVEAKTDDAALRAFCQELTAATTTLLGYLRLARDQAARDLEATHADLHRQARHLQAGDQGGDRAIAPVRLADDIALSEPQALAPISEAIGAARLQHSEQAALAQRAETQIEPAERLDRAIESATTRLNTLTRLHSHLADGKFLRYLTDQRTRSLLILASQLFSQLSSGRFGFSDDFRIVNLATRTPRSPKTLSGGETFLASLALALALIELHSRNGARLGSLFLDEGFGALDSTALSSALSVLRRESGGDKLVTVISHLHTVAEAVDQVLWINRTPDGSQARWLTEAQRAALIYDHVQSGLLSLADQAS